jgi:soluble lytic murein transglycosylase-like protein
MVEPIRKGLFPGVMAGILCVILMANLAASPDKALASTVVPADSAVLSPVISAAPVEKNKSPAEILFELFAPLLFRQEAARPDSTPQPDSSSTQEDHASPSDGCSIGTGFSENVRRWCDLITRTGAENSLDPSLIAAVMTVESGGKPDAYSHNGAVGLMQVMPRDGIAASFSCVSGPCFANRPSMAELYQPEYNLEYAGRMLAGLINQHGNWRDALRAYGPAGAGYSYADKVLGVYSVNR